MIARYLRTIIKAGHKWEAFVTCIVYKQCLDWKKIQVIIWCNGGCDKQFGDSLKSSTNTTRHTLRGIFHHKQDKSYSRRPCRDGRKANRVIHAQLE